jgi:hypothetical protein
MFDALHPDAADFALAERVRRPDRIPAPKIGAFAGFGEALRTMFPAAATESTRALSPLLDAYGKAAAFGYGAAREDSIDRMDVNDLSPLLGRELKKLTPDPQTTGTASQIVFGMGKLLGKAAGYSVLAGPYAGAALTGADEGANETLKLTDKGVDSGTALKAGAVHSAVTALNVALPVAGKTIAQTAGLALTGGPLSFIGENTAIRAILERADYAEAAKDYDPFSPVGLTVSTLAPLMFGAAAHALRGKAKAADAPDMAPRMAPEQVDAALVLNRARQAEEVNLAPRSDFAARSAHADALEAAGRSLDTGRPLTLNALPLDAERAAPALARLREAAPAIEARAEQHAPLDDADAIVMPKPAEASAPAPVAESPDLVQARQIALDNPDLPIFTGAVDEQGNRASVRAGDLLAEAELDAAEARGLRPAFEAAINCFLRNPA